VSCPPDFFGPYPLLDFGRHRAVYDAGRNVLKVPRHEKGYYDNLWEHDKSRSYGLRPDVNGIFYARCRALPSGILVMEKVIDPPSRMSLPDWVGYVDCQQVGLTRDGRIVAYDFGVY
jgi:hypothetical protein